MMGRTGMMGWCALVLALAGAGGAGAAESDHGPLAVLNGEVNGKPAEEMMNRFLLRRADQHWQQWQERYEQRTEPDEIEAYQERLKKRFLDAIGGLPERTPLNARTVGTIERDGFIVKRVIFESRPKHYVTAALYLPAPDRFEPPYPGVVVPCGHSKGGKARDLYQRAPALAALSGMAALCFDPIEQGERMQLLDEDGEPVVWGTKGHTMMAVGSMLVGRGTAHYEIWDGMRAIDYLQSRPEVDGDRIGCMGVSGGGTQTAYLMALDDRIDAAAPACYITSFDRLLNTIGAQDAEQNIHGQLAFGMDHADYLMMRAPKPTLIGAATDDFFDITGTWDSFRYAKRLYTRMGFGRRVGIVEVDAGHNYDAPLRQASVRWMLRWLADRDEPITEPTDPPIPVLSAEKIRSTPKGQVALLDDYRSTYEINEAYNERLAERRAETWSGNLEAARQKVREIAGIRSLEELPEPRGVERTGIVEHEGRRIEKLVFEPEDGIVLPALLAAPEEADEPTEPPVLCVHEKGKRAALQTDRARQLLEAGRAVLAVDPRGTGETQQDDQGYLAPEFGRDAQDFLTAYLLGDSYVGMRAEDVLSCARWLREEAGSTPELIAIGNVGIPALHAAALEPELFDAVRIERSLISWTSVVEAHRTRDQLNNVVHGALRVYDLPNLARTLGPKLTIEDPMDAMGEPTSPDRSAPSSNGGE